MSDLPTYTSPRAVADRLGVNYRTVLRWIDSGQLKACKINMRVLIDEASVAALLEESELPAKASG